MKNILFVILILIFVCCKDYSIGHYSIYNNSGRPICYYMPWMHGIHYPDTVLPEKSPNYIPIDKSRHSSYGEGKNVEDQLFALFPTDTISVFFFDPDTLVKYKWEIIRQKYKMLIRYDLSRSDLKKLNWCIYYPPTEAMKEMKMYPPYGTE